MNDAIKKAKLFIKNLTEKGIDVNKAYLFGSYATGKAKKDSDIDICVISPSFTDDYYAEMVKLRKLSMQIDSRIEPVPFSPEDLNDKYSTLASEIRKYGTPL